ncbi:MAG: hypothetical protein P8P99_15785 [Maricaulis sp.]|jgi:hypothetical protein|nr:hypothetical protein [Maricaulis sp.]
MDNRALNALLALIVALAIAATPSFWLGALLVERIYELAGTPDINLFEPGLPMFAWAMTGLIGTALLVRPLENLIRVHGYQMDSAEDHRGVDFSDGVNDQISDEAEEALAKFLDDELKRK